MKSHGLQHNSNETKCDFNLLLLAHLAGAFRLNPHSSWDTWDTPMDNSTSVFHHTQRLMG